MHLWLRFLPGGVAGGAFSPLAFSRGPSSSEIDSLLLVGTRA